MLGLALTVLVAQAPLELQWTAPEQCPTEASVRGRLGAWIKESVCRFTVRALRYPRVQAVFALYDRRGRAVLAAAPPPRALPEPTA